MNLELQKNSDLNGIASAMIEYVRNYELSLSYRCTHVPLLNLVQIKMTLTLVIEKVERCGSFSAIGDFRHRFRL